MIKFIQSLCISFVILNSAVAQFDATLQAEIPTNPTAASLAEYAEIPVSYYTGVPSVAIPLYTITDNQISHPIGLSYHSSGIKVSQRSSAVGLGWSLKAGGVITRSVRGAPDEQLYDGQLSGYYEDGVDPNWVNNSIERDRIISGKRDVQSDIYFYNFGSYSGSFMFDDSGNVIQKERTDLKIKPMNTGYSHNKLIWKITTPDGTQYYFGDDIIDDVTNDAVSYSQNYTHKEFEFGAPVRSSPLVDSWFLVKIESFDSGSIIDFEYDDFEVYSTRDVTSAIRGYIDEDGRNLIYPNIADVFNEAAFLKAANQIIVSERLTPRLTQVKSSTREIEFNYSATKRKDLSWKITEGMHPKDVLGIQQTNLSDPKALDHIEVKTLDNQCMKRYDLNTSYFTSGDNGNFSLSFYEIDSTDSNGDYYSDMRRLRLDDVKETSCDGTTALVHTFDYTTDTIARAVTFNQDHHGYYNGAGNKTLVPQLMINEGITNPPIVDLSHLSFLADRECNPMYAQDAMLKKITLPTGGTREFTYESHDYRRSIIQETENSVFSIKSCSSAFNFGACDGDPLVSNSHTLGTNANIRYELIVEATRAVDDMNNDEIDIQLEYQHNNGAWTNIADLRLSQTNGFSVLKCYSDRMFNDADIGTYRFRLVPDDPNRNVYLFMNLKSFARQTATETRPLGGLRIASITDNPITGQSITKTLNYVQSQSNSNSSGVLISMPTYITDLPAGSDYFESQSNECYAIGFGLNSGSVFSMASVQGNHIGYSRIEEYVDDGTNGYIEHKFKNFPPIASVIKDYPVLPEYYVDDQAGKPTTTKYFNGSGQTIKNTTRDYTTYEHGDESQSLTVQGYTDCNANTTTLDFINWSTFSRHVYMDEMTETLDGVSTTTNYTYGDLPNHLRATQIEMTNSDSKVHSTEFSYIFDYTENDSIRAQLIRENRIANPWQTLKKVNGVAVDGSQVLYGYMNQSTGAIFQPSSIQAGNKIYPRDVKRREVTWNQSGISDQQWVLQYSNTDFHLLHGLVTQKQHVGWAHPVELSYDPLIPRLTKWKYDNYTQDRLYDNLDLLDQTIAIDGTQTSYNWDELVRLESVTNCLGVDTEYEYNYGLGDDLNYLQTVSTYPNFGSFTNHKIKNVKFLDGLGRPLQDLAQEQDPDDPMESIAHQITYDHIGRMIQKHEPVNSTSVADGYSSANTDFTSINYEKSLLNRQSSITPPDWYESKILYATNSTNEVLNLGSGGSYPASSLYKKISVDPDNKVLEEFTDKVGNLILSRRKSSLTVTAMDSIADTYYTYDDKLRISKTIPPDAVIANTNLIYEKRYSGEDNLLYHKVPDAEPVQFAYDDRNLLRYRQDGERAKESKWYAMEYDDYGQLLKEGFVNDTSSAISDPLISNIYGDTGIEKAKLTQTDTELLTTDMTMRSSYAYDNCGRLVITKQNSILHPSFGSIVHTIALDDADQVLNDVLTIPSENLTITKRNTYDHAGRHKKSYITVVHPDHAGPEVELCEKSYTVKEQVKQKIIGSGLQQVDYGYLKNRFLNSINSPYNSFASSDDLFAIRLGYDENIDALITGETFRKNGDITAIQWRYRDQNGIPQAKNAYRLDYDFLDRLTDAYHFKSGGNNRYSTTYQYEDKRGNFDKITRRSNGILVDNLSFNTTSNSNQIGTVNELSNSSMSSMGFGGGSSSYSWDDNGFMTNDGETDASLVRDHNNMSQEVVNTIDGVHIMSHRDASTVLHRREIIKNGSVTNIDYINHLEYRNGLLSMIHHEDGFITLDRGVPEDIMLTDQFNHTMTEEGISITSDRDLINGADEENFAQTMIQLIPGFNVMPGAEYLADIRDYDVEGFDYHYVIRDHLGSPRVVFQDMDKDGTIETGDVESAHQYYPFGMEWEDEEATMVPQYRDKFNSKEDVTHTQYVDYGARALIKSIGRFDGVDPAADLYPMFASTSYANVSPIRYNDYLGLMISYNWNSGKYEDEDGNERSWNDVKREHNLSHSKFNVTLLNQDKNLSSSQLVNVANYASNIFSKNGVSDFVTYSITNSKSKFYNSGIQESENRLGFRFVKRGLAPFGATKFVESDWGATQNLDRSYINLRPHVNPDGSYNTESLGYTLAHETLHGLLAKASHSMTGRRYDLINSEDKAGHYDSFPNLLNGGQSQYANLSSEYIMKEHVVRLLVFKQYLKNKIKP